MTATTSPNNENLVPGVAVSGATAEGFPPTPTQVVAAANATLIVNQAATAVTHTALILTASTSATVVTVNTHYHQQVHIPSQQAVAIALAAAATAEVLE